MVSRATWTRNRLVIKNEDYVLKRIINNLAIQKNSFLLYFTLTFDLTRKIKLQFYEISLLTNFKVFLYPKHMKPYKTSSHSNVWQELVGSHHHMTHSQTAIMQPTLPLLKFSTLIIVVGVSFACEPLTSLAA